MKILKYFLYLVFMFGILCSQSISDLQKAQKLYDEYLKKQSEIGNQQIFIDPGMDSMLTEADTLFNYLGDESIKDEIPYFGYDFFTLRDSIRIWPNVSAPDNYILGPGDNLEISIWGRAQLNNNYTINQNGNIYDESIGLVSLVGKTLKEARILLFNNYSKKISSLKGNNPSSFLNVDLGKLKSINVHFVGRVKYPGVHLLHPLSTVMTGLLQAGGVDTTGSLRKISIKRNGELLREVDLYDFLINGNNTDNTLLQNNDIIIVPIRLSTVTILGNVYHQAKFEAHFSETLSDIVGYAGGIKPNTSDKFTLRRIIPLNERDAQISTNQKDIMITYTDLSQQQIKDGDVLNSFELPILESFVTISGQVKEPGDYILTDSLSLKDLLVLAGGIEDNDYLKSINLDQIEVLRIDPGSDENFVEKINFKEFITTDKYDNYFLQRDDHIVVHKNIFYSHESVIIEGEVKRPGVYSLGKNDKSLNKLIESAGGLTINAFKDGITVHRDTSKLIWDNFNVTLSDGDSINVPEKPFSVFVTGEVYNPGYIHFKNGKSVKKYIESAGGRKPTGSKKDILVIHPNGNVKTRSVFPRKVPDGSTIIVNVKPKKDAFNYGSFLRETISLATSLALTYVAIERLK